MYTCRHWIYSMRSANKNKSLWYNSQFPALATSESSDMHDKQVDPSWSPDVQSKGTTAPGFAIVLKLRDCLEPPTPRIQTAAFIQITKTCDMTSKRVMEYLLCLIAPS